MPSAGIVNLSKFGSIDGLCQVEQSLADWLNEYNTTHLTPLPLFTRNHQPGYLFLSPLLPVWPKNPIQPCGI
jgi:hypothetical protein